MVLYTEAARQRDLQRYYQPWLDSAQNLVDGDGAEGSTHLVYAGGYEAKSSQDKSLTAFAQLIVLRLDVKRAMVSLIDSTRQYILAEATRTLSLNTHSTEDGDEMWLGHATIVRSDAVCHNTFGSEYTALEANGETYVADALVIPDCRFDARVSDKDYVVSEPGVRFYAGVPITTKAGYSIGVFAVSDDKPRHGLSASEVRAMEDISGAVMEHLELAKERDDRSKGERMVRGLTEFIERSSVQGARSRSRTRQTTLNKQTENARLDALADDPSPDAIPPPSEEAQPPRKREDERAHIMRQSARADGVVFFDTSSAMASGPIFESSSSTASSEGYSSTAGSAATVKKRRRGKGPASNVKGDNGVSNEGVPANSIPCPLVGLSLRSGGLGVSEHDFVFTDASMERYIDRYPHGKFFNFDEEGIGINSSDDKSERSEPEQPDATAANIAAQKARKRRTRFVPTELLSVLPNVRSLIFLPLWDPASERWAAGAFIWTMAAGRLMNPDTEFPFLKAFGNSVISEIARWNALKSDRTKTTFIASISHELRSPLHGILGSVEFLRDAISSPYQQSLVDSIETCGRTLLDTIDHVLDYAKINKLRSVGARKKHRGGKRANRLPADNSILGVTTVFNLSQLVEEVCDTVCGGHHFRKSHDIHNVAFHDQGTRSRANSNSSTNAGEANYSGVRTKDRVVVTLSVAPSVQWIVKSQPGALRRVVMNLLGNALKYTESGFITIHLTQDIEKSTEHNVVFTIAVEDSGKGMSSEYQRTKLFAPFSQEDPFSNGTGLGLSIVKQIIDSLKGEISVESKPNMGTKLSVTLSLPAGSAEYARSKQTLLESPKELEKKTAAVLYPEISLGGAGEKLRQSMFMACQGFYMEPSVEYDGAKLPDFLLTEPDTLLGLLREEEWKKYPRQKPLVVVCICTDPTEKTMVESQLKKEFSHCPWVIEVVAQPCGPRRLAKLLVQSLRRVSQPVTSLVVHAEDSVRQSSQPELPIVHRSVSDLVRGSDAVPSSIAAVHSPLISATMPAVAEPSLPDGQIEQPVETPASEGPSEYFTPRVLLVDDNAINLKLLVVFAQRQNFRYVEAVNGLEAFKSFEREALATSPPARPFDFILMDLSMPVMGGLESTRHIRQFELEHGLSPCTIVALTGLASAQDQQDAVDAGMDMYLVKPVKFADIKRVFGAK